MPVLVCVAGMILVGSSIAVSRFLLAYPTLTGQAIRYALAAAILLLIAQRFPRLGEGQAIRPRHSELAVLAALAATGLAGFNAGILLALRHADAAVIGTVIGAAPLGLALLGPLLRGQRPTVRLLAAAAVVAVGTAPVQGTGRADPVGLAAAAGALAGEVAFSLLAARVLPRLGAVRVAAYSCGLAVPLLLAAAVATGEPHHWRLPTTAEAIALAYLTVGMTVVAFLLWFTGLQRLGLDRAGMIVGVMPIATLTTAAVLAGRLPAAGPVIGVLIVAAGLSLGLIPARKVPPSSTVDGLVLQG